VKQKIDLKDKKKSQTNEKFNDVSSGDEIKCKHMTVQPLFKNYKNMIPLFNDRRPRSCTCS
jgi:hypothetical protein